MTSSNATYICIPEYHSTEEGKHVRYVLKSKPPGTKPLFVIGLNTSTANENELDKTVKKAMNLAAENGYNGFVMFNLYPLRKTKPKDLPKTDEQKLLKENIKRIKMELGKVSNPTILAAWGCNIDKKSYFRESLREIVEFLAAKKVDWKRYGKLTDKTKHPRHLSRAPNAKLEVFDIDKYMNGHKFN